MKKIISNILIPKEIEDDFLKIKNYKEYLIYNNIFNINMSLKIILVLFTMLLHLFDINNIIYDYSISIILSILLFYSFFCIFKMLQLENIKVKNEDVEWLNIKTKEPLTIKRIYQIMNERYEK